MIDAANSTGIAIALAWPETYCKQPGAWYDGIARWVGANYNNYYKVGHAAIVLIENKTGKCYYFDFGRYHAPFQYGRVRGEETDHDLKMNTKAKLTHDGQIIENYVEILTELQKNKACHGEGSIYASYCPVNFKLSYNKAMDMQQKSPIPYGPFKVKGSNCSRFVNTVILAGTPLFKYKFKLQYLVPFTPTPLNNVNSLPHKTRVEKILTGEAFCPIRKLDMKVLKSTLPEPAKHSNIPNAAQWLGGEGAGSWFTFEFQNTILQVNRYSPEGVIECKGLYENSNGYIIKEDDFSISYPSNCKTVTLKAKEKEIKFERVFN